jgi:hypothetical protein
MSILDAAQLVLFAIRAVANALEGVRTNKRVAAELYAQWRILGEQLHELLALGRLGEAHRRPLETLHALADETRAFLATFAAQGRLRQHTSWASNRSAFASLSERLASRAAALELGISIDSAATLLRMDEAHALDMHEVQEALSRVHAGTELTHAQNYETQALLREQGELLRELLAMSAAVAPAAAAAGAAGAAAPPPAAPSADELGRLRAELGDDLRAVAAQSALRDDHARALAAQTHAQSAEALARLAASERAHAHSHELLRELLAHSRDVAEPGAARAVAEQHRLLHAPTIRRAQLVLATGRPLGKGAHGVVRRARLDGALDVAVKAATVDDERAARLMLRELRTLQALRHPHVVLLLGVVDAADDGELWAVLELAPHGSLERVLRLESQAARDEALGAPAGARSLPGATASWLRAGVQLAAALAFLHGRGVGHGDVKPANVLVFLGGALKLADFGLAAVARTMRTAGLSSTATSGGGGWRGERRARD